jgi:hypothetical protein
MEKEWYPISHLLAHAYHTMDYYHRTRCIFEKCDCENKLQQLQEFYGIFIGVN